MWVTRETIMQWCNNWSVQQENFSHILGFSIFSFFRNYLSICILVVQASVIIIMHKWKELPFVLSTDYVLLSIVLTQYLKEHDSDNWSYVEFLNLNRNAIIKLPPFNVKWTSLDGTWYRRFLQEACELDPASANMLKERVFYFFL